MKEKLIDHFTRYSGTNVVYVSNGQLFLTEAAALSYGKGEVKKVTRAEVMPSANPAEGEQNGGGETKIPSEQAPLTQETIEAMSYEQLKAEVKARDITVEGRAKEVLVAALLATIEGKEA